MARSRRRRLDPLGVEPGQVPDDQGAPIVADEHGLLMAGLVDQGQQVIGEVADAVVGHVLRRLTSRPALVGRDDVVSGRRERTGS